jgi:SAM-dependent methyltransferase
MPMPERDREEDLVDRGCREHYEDPALYDHEYRRRRQDVSFYRRLARELLGGTGRILELACGSGRVTTGLLRDGHQVVGLDLSPAMLERAAARVARLGRAARSRATLALGDVRAFDLGARFPLCIMAFNSFEHLYTRVEVAACLERVRAHLEEGGRFVFDVQNPNLNWLVRDPARRWARTVFRHPTTGQRIAYSTNHVYDPVSQIAVIRIYYDPVDPPPPRASRGAGEREALATLRGSTRGEPEDNDEPSRVVVLTQRKFFPAELEALVAQGGFTVENRYGDFAGEPLTGGAESQLLVCRVRGPSDTRR